MSDPRRPISGILADETVLDLTGAASDGLSSVDTLPFVAAFERDAAADDTAGSHRHDTVATGDMLSDWSAPALGDADPNAFATTEAHGHRPSSSDDLPVSHVDTAGSAGHGSDPVPSADTATGLTLDHAGLAGSHRTPDFVADHDASMVAATHGSPDIDLGPTGADDALPPSPASPFDAPMWTEHTASNSGVQGLLYAPDSDVSVAVPETQVPAAPVDPELWISATSGGPPENLILHADDTGTGVASNVGTLFTPDSSNNPTTPSFLPAIDFLELDTQNSAYFLASTDSGLHSQIVEGSLAAILANPTSTPSYTTLFTGTSAVTGIAVDPDHDTLYFATGDSFEKVAYSGGAPTVLDNTSTVPLDGVALDLPNDVAYFVSGKSATTTTTNGSGIHYHTNASSSIYKTSTLTPSSNSVTITDLKDIAISTYGDIWFGVGEPGITVDPVTGLIYFTTGSVSGSPSGVYSLNPNTKAITTIWAQGAGGGPTGELEYIVIDHATGKYYVTVANRGSEGGAIYVGNLNANGTTPPTLFETMPTYDSGTVSPNPNGFSLDNAPTLSVTGTSAEAIQGGSATALLASTPTVSDSDNDKSVSATIQITNAKTGDALFVNGQQSGSFDGGQVTVSWNSSTHTLTLSGADSLAAYQTLLSEVTYQDTGTDSSSGSHPTRSISWTVSDGLLSSPTMSTTVTIDRSPTVVADGAGVVVGATATADASHGILSNDSDLDGDTVTLSSFVNAASVAGIFGNSLIGTYGHLTLQSSGAYSYVADLSSAIAGAALGSHPKDVFTYTDSDGLGGSASGTLTFTIDRLPTLTADSYSVVEGTSASGTGGTGGTGVLGNDSDPDGDSLDVDAVNGSGGNVGAGVAGSYGTLTLNANGSFSYVIDGAETAGAPLGSHLTDLFHYTVDDGHGGSATQQITFSIDRVPVLGADNYGLVEGGTSSGTSGTGGTGVLGNDSDPDGDSLAVSQVNSLAGNVGSSVAGTYGHLTLQANGAYSYVADLTGAIDAAPVGSHPLDQFHYTVSDGQGGTTTTTVTFSIDRAPTLGADSYGVVEGGTSSGTSGTGGTGVLGNDSDPDGDTLTVSQVNSLAGNVGSSVAGTYGHLTLQANGAYSYVADLTTAIDAAPTGSHPLDLFHYTVGDGLGGTTTTTVTFSVDRLPTLGADGYGVVEGASASGTAGAGGTGVLGNDSDPDGDTLTVSQVDGLGGNVGAGVAGSYGTLTLNANGSFGYVTNSAAIDAAPVGSHPLDLFHYTVSDGHGGTATQDIAFTVDRAPVLGADSYGVVESGGASGTAGTGGTGVLGNDSDPDGDSLAVSAVNGLAGNVGTSVAGTYGHLTLNGDGSYSYVADLTGAIDAAPLGSHPLDQFHYTVGDGQGGTTTTTVTFSVDRLPAADPDSRAVLASDSVSGTSGTGGTGVLGNDSDPDGDTLTVSQVDGLAGNVGTSVAGTYGHLTLNGDGSYTYLADTAAAIDAAPTGAHPLDVFHYTIDDGQGGTATQDIAFTIDRAPVLGADNYAVAEGGSVSGTAGTGGTGVLGNDSDPDGDSLAVTGVNNNAGNLGNLLAGQYGSLTLNEDGSFSYVTNSAAIDAAPTGAHPIDRFTYSVSDAHGGSTTQNIAITIDRPPTAAADSVTALQGGSLAVDAAHGVLANDSDPDGDTLTVTEVDGLAGKVGTPVAGTYGSLTLNADGSYSFAVDDAAVNAQPNDATLTDSFTYSEDDGLGGTGTSQITITIDQTPALTGFVATTTAKADFTAPHTVAFAIATGKDVFVTGTPTLTLSDGGTATYVSGSGTKSLVFQYAATDAPSTALSVSAVAGGTIADQAGNALPLAGQSVSLFTVAVADTIAHIDAHWDDLNAVVGDLSDVHITTPGHPVLTLTVSQLLGDTALFGLLEPATYSIAVHDTAAAVEARFDNLAARGGILHVAFTDPGTPTLTLTQAQVTADAALLKTVQGPYTLDVTNVTGQPFGEYLKHYNAVSQDAYVTEFNTDGSTKIVAYLGGMSFTGTAFGDNFTAVAGDGDSFTGLGGNDTFHFTGNFDATDRISGGPGTDILYLNGDYSGAHAVTFADATMTGVENLHLLGGHSYDLTFAAGNVPTGQTLVVNAVALATNDSLTLDGTALPGALNIATGGTGDSVGGGAGNDRVSFASGGGNSFDGNDGNDRAVLTGTGSVEFSGGAGNDLFQFTGNFIAADRIDGGAGTDELYLNGDYTGAHALTFGANTMTTVETLYLHGGHDYDITLAAANLPAGQTLKLSAATLVPTDNLVFDGGAAQGNLVIYAGGSGDTITGGSGNDQFIIGSGSGDTITGGSGNDKVNGSALSAADNIVFNGNGGADTIAGGHGNNIYEFDDIAGQTLYIANGFTGGTAAHGELDFDTGITDENLWLERRGNNLVTELLGTTERVTIANWFGTNNSAQLSEVKAGGLKLDAQVTSLVAAMATYTAANRGFDPATAAAMPTDSALQNAIAADWHH